MSDIFNLYREAGLPLGEDLRTNAPYWAANEITTLRQQLADALDTQEILRGNAEGAQRGYLIVKAQLEQAEARIAQLEADNLHQRERRDAARKMHL